jgi:hypothetical protein
VAQLLGEALLRLTGDSSGLRSELNAAKQQTQELGQQTTNTTRQMAGSWREFVSQNLGEYRRMEGSHSAAMKRLSAEWATYRAAGTTATAAVGASVTAMSAALTRSTALIGAGLATMRTSLVGLSSSMNLLIGGGLLALGNRFSNAASDLNESASKVGVVFGDAARKVEAFGETSARAYGVSKQAAFEASGTFGNLFTTIGLGQATSAEMSVSLVKLAADLASFNNLNPGEVLDKLRSGLVGEVEPLRALGVNMNEATVAAAAMQLGLAKNKDELTEGAKLQARYALILEQTRTAQGDFARTADGAANKQRILAATAADSAAALGRSLLPITISVTGALTRLLEIFNRLPDSVKDTVVKVGLATGALLALTAAGGLLAPVVTGLIGLVKGLGLVLLGLVTNPIALGIGAVVALGVAFVKFGGPVDETKQRLQLLGQGALAVFNVLKGTAQSIVALAASIGQVLGTLSVAMEQAGSLNFAGAWETLRAGINLEGFAKQFEGASATLGLAGQQFAATFQGKVLPSTIAVGKSIEDFTNGIKGAIAPVATLTGNTGAGGFGTGLTGLGGALGKTGKEAELTTAQVKALIPEAKQLVIALAQAEASRDPKRIEAASLAVDAFTRAHKGGSEAIQQATRILKPYLDGLAELARRQQAIADYLQSRKFDAWSDSLRNATDKQLENARALALQRGELEKVRAIDGEIDRRADLRTQKQTEHNQAVKDGTRDVLDFAKGLEKQLQSGELTADNIRDNVSQYAALKQRLAEAGVSWNEVEGVVRNRVNGTLAAQISLLQRLEYQHTRQIQQNRDLATAAKDLADRLQYQNLRIAGLADSTARTILQSVYDALSTNDPFNIQAALAKTNEFIKSDGFQSLPDALQEAVRSAVPMMQQVLDEAELTVQVDLEPVFMADRAARVDYLEKWAKGAADSVTDYLQTDTSDLEKAAAAIERELSLPGLDFSQQERLQAQLKTTRDMLQGVADARKGYADAVAQEQRDLENGTKDMWASFEEGVELFQKLNNEAEGSAAAQAINDLNGALEDLPGVQRLTALFNAVDDFAPATGDWLRDALAAGDVDAIAAQLQNLPHDVLQALAPEFIDAGDDLGKGIYTAILRAMRLRAEQTPQTELPAVPLADEYTDYNLAARLDELDTSLNNLDLIDLNAALAEFNDYLALENLDPDVLARVEGLKKRTQELIDSIAPLDFSSTDIGTLMADLFPVFEAVGENWQRALSDVLSDADGLNAGALAATLAGSLVGVTDEALQELFAHFAAMDNPFGKLIAAWIDSEAAARALAKENDEPVVVFGDEPLPAPRAPTRPDRSPPAGGKRSYGRNDLTESDLGPLREGMQLGTITSDQYADSLEQVILSLESIRNPSQEVINRIAALRAELDGVRNPLDDLREGFALGTVTTDQYQKGLETAIKTLEASGDQSLGTKNKIAVLRRELEDLTSPTGKILQGLQSLASTLRGFGDVTLDGLATIIETGVSAFKSFSTGDIIGGITTIAQTLVQAFTAAKREMEAFRKEFDGLVKSFSVIDVTGIIKTKTSRGGFLGLGTKTEIDQEASQLGLTIATSLEGGVKSGLANGFRAFLDGTGSILSGLRDGLKGAIITAITEAIIQGAIIKGALGALLTSLTEAFASGDYAGAANIVKQIGAALPALAANLEIVLKPLKDAFAVAFPGAPGGSIANLEQERTRLQEQYDQATSDSERRDLQARIDDLERQIEGMRGNLTAPSTPSLALPPSVQIAAYGPLMTGLADGGAVLAAAATRIDGVFVRADAMYARVEAMYDRLMTQGFRITVDAGNREGGLSTAALW